MKSVYRNELKNYTNILLFSTVCSVLHIFFANYSGIFKYLSSQQNQLFNSFFDIIISTIIISVFLSFCFLINFRFTKYLVLIANFIGLIYSYFVAHFGITINQHIVISALFYSESNDILSSFDYWIFIYCIPPIVALYLIINFFQKKLNIYPLLLSNIKSLKNYFKLFVVRFSFLLTTALFLILFINTNAYIMSYKLKTILEQMMPTYLIVQAKEIILTQKSLTHQELKGYDEYKIKFKQQSQQPLLVVIVVGESLRSDRLSANGYHKNTTPNISKIANLFLFKNVLSCATTTSPSLLCMMTDENQDQFLKKFSDSTFEKKYSIGKIFSDLGFYVTVLSNANKDSGIYTYKNFHSPNKIISASELRKKHLSKTNDYGDLIMLEEIETKINQNSLYILGTRGSHREYYSNYPRSFAKFTPDLGHSAIEINNSYDNTVVYFDNFFDQLIKKLSNNNAVIFYVSDHGESLGENNVYLHGAPVSEAPKEQRLVPMIVWMSDKFISQNKKRFYQLKKNNLLNRNDKLAVKHDHFFHSILGCLNFESRKIENSLNLCANF